MVLRRRKGKKSRAFIPVWVNPLPGFAEKGWRHWRPFMCILSPPGRCLTWSCGSPTCALTSRNWRRTLHVKLAWEATDKGLYQPAPSDENVSLYAPGHAGISVFLCFINSSTMCDLHSTKSTLVESLNSGCSYVDKVVQEPVLSDSFPSHQAETQCLLAATPYSVPALLSGPGNH